ncbi:SDR family oxidoreductase [Pseudomonas sp. TTU2014-080ASC]|uniref:SDR family oxidoreductase n=1 Tax=Pseudomonas sp. TTU2014-080ASC TaxID=1729724 RepID=UPI00071835F1|nr:SDR family oxidoreductase [Pseudomonas sp. TTU2014-080ASC]KRW60919.1 short-chain dehydrogenase [Pseudomonas sp. TTU2014-080ASC]
MNSLKRVIIFGATSSIAEQTARLLVAQGASIYCIGRSPKKLKALIDDLKVRASTDQCIDGCAANLTDTSQHARLIETAERVLGGIDSVLIAHGTLPNQKACQTDTLLTRQEFETNALSVIDLLTLIANYFEQQQHGVIAVISSVAGDRGRQSNYVYGAAKGMVTLFLQGLRNRLSKANVDVVTIKPGFVDTPMTDGLDKRGPLWAKPKDIATGIIKAMRTGKGEVYLPWFWKGIMLVIRHIPDSIFKRMSL